MVQEGAHWSGDGAHQIAEQLVPGMEAAAAEIESDMVKRVADVINEILHCDRYADPAVIARAAIAAMRKPTGVMIDAGHKVYEEDVLFAADGGQNRCWQAMIETALDPAWTDDSGIANYSSIATTQAGDPGIPMYRLADATDDVLGMPAREKRS